MDGSYDDILKIYTILDLQNEYFAFENQFKELSNKLEISKPKQLISEIKLLVKKLNKIPDNRKIISSLNKVNRNLKKKKIDYFKVNKNFDIAYELYSKKASAIKDIDKNITVELKNYLNVISSSIGVRQQSKIPRDLALYLASCRSTHKDLTLYF